jgi:hypothetical protein
MTSVRPGRPPLTAEAARAEIARHSGSQFDPNVAGAALGMSIESMERERERGFFATVSRPALLGIAAAAVLVGLGAAHVVGLTGRGAPTASASPDVGSASGSPTSAPPSGGTNPPTPDSAVPGSPQPAGTSTTTAPLTAQPTTTALATTTAPPTTIATTVPSTTPPTAPPTPAPTPPPTVPIPVGEFLVSNQSNRTGAVLLEGAQLPQPLAMFLPDNPQMKSVSFTMTDFMGQVVLTSGETCSPWDVGKTEGNSCPAIPNARAGLLSGFVPGAYELKAEITMVNGKVEVRSARFTITG